MKSEDEQILILVDKKDKESGYVKRGKAHLSKGLKHRAFMVFLVNSKGFLLLTKRSKLKTLWPEFWDASVASHVLKGEDYKKAVVRRISEELNFKISPKELKDIGGFSYQSEYKNNCSENEFCRIFLAKLNKPVKVNENEISEIKFISQREITSQLSLPTEKFTPWFKIGYRVFLGSIKN